MISIILTTFNRNALLQLTLPRIRSYFDGPIIIIDDGIESAEQVAKDWNCRYHRTGNKRWRCPAWAFNIGVELSETEDIVLSCAEIYHATDFLSGLKPGNMEMVIPHGKDDSGMYLAYLKRHKKGCPEVYHFLPKLNTRLPFCMAMKRSLYQDIGGYDEGFIGQGYDDDDFVTRLSDYGCTYRTVQERVVHLYHDRTALTRNRRALEYNRKLFNARRGIIVRNIGV